MPAHDLKLFRSCAVNKAKGIAASGAMGNKLAHRERGDPTQKEKPQNSNLCAEHGVSLSGSDLPLSASNKHPSLRYIHHGRPERSLNGLEVHHDLLKVVQFLIGEAYL